MLIRSVGIGCTMYNAGGPNKYECTMDQEL